MKRFFSVLGLMAIMAGSATYAQVEIGYAKEGGDTQYDAVKFFFPSMVNMHQISKWQ